MPTGGYLDSKKWYQPARTGDWAAAAAATGHHLVSGNAQWAGRIETVIIDTTDIDDCFFQRYNSIILGFMCSKF